MDQNQMNDLQMDQQTSVYSYSENIHFRGVNISQPNICTVVSAPGNVTNLDSHYLLDAYDNVMMHETTQYIGIHHQHNLDMGVPAAANLYYSGMNSSSSTAVSLNHRASRTNKLKNARGMRGNCHYFSATSSSIAPPNSGHIENGIPLLSNQSLRSRSDESIMMHDLNHLIQGNYSGQHFRPVAPHQQLNSNNNDGHALSWNQSLLMPYVQAPNANGILLDNASMGLQRRCHNTGGNRHGLRFHGPPLVNPHYGSFHHQSQLGQEMRGHPINYHPPEIAASYRVPTDPSHHASIPIQNAFGVGARHVGLVPFTGEPIFQPRRSNMHRITGRHRDLPPMISVQVDDIALLDDHHRDMRMNIENMSYEELLALGERIGNATTPLSEEIINSQMKTKTYLLPTRATNLEEAASDELELDSCIICQDAYHDNEKIGILPCGHEYHTDCLRKWLLVKNVCPICKSEALTIGKEGV